jgi:hypothetical protein
MNVIQSFFRGSGNGPKAQLTQVLGNLNSITFGHAGNLNLGAHFRVFDPSFYLPSNPEACIHRRS